MLQIIKNKTIFQNFDAWVKAFVSSAASDAATAVAGDAVQEVFFFYINLYFIDFLLFLLPL